MKHLCAHSSPIQHTVMTTEVTWLKLCTPKTAALTDILGLILMKEEGTHQDVRMALCG
jgi:hypothetical protein